MNGDREEVQGMRLGSCLCLAHIETLGTAGKGKGGFRVIVVVFLPMSLPANEHENGRPD